MTNVDHSEFVSTKQGCNQKEVIYVIIISALGIFFRNICIPWIFLGKRFNTSVISYWFKFIIDVIFIVAPPLLSLTIFANHLEHLLIILATSTVILLFFVAFEYYQHPFGHSMKNSWNRIIDETYHPTTFVTYLRASTMILTVCAILAVDFPIFPRRFSKTDSHGHSLMDTGVSAAVFISGLSSRMARSQSSGRPRNPRFTKWYTSSTFLLFLIGFARMIVLEFVGYPQHVNEYGIHWNFFFTMAVVRIAYTFLPRKFPFATSIVLGVCHQTLLNSGYQYWILTEGENQRENLIAANAEGIFSLLGYLTIFYASLAVGDILASTCIRIKSWIRRAFHMAFLSFLMYVCQVISEQHLDQPSRRVVNLTYIFSQLFLMIGATSLLLFIQMFNIVVHSSNVPQFSNGETPFDSLTPCLCESINLHSLEYFLLSNVLTGIVNMSINAHETRDETISLSILTVYMFIGVFIVHSLAFRRTKIVHSE
ncbi:unnamed protein product [Caenorhabditis bovis]|uniref:Phosphatidylinositol-glycan biosynthesis class W protein n=1 Tax=Caenorhabditis bovis TaxID=2654633 RepID=A0A8S1EYC4_9PELO|nr:unnamed protein product [Caenorhabditis bovis]